MEQNGKICLRDSETLSVNMRKKFYNLYGPSKLAKSTFFYCILLLYFLLLYMLFKQNIRFDKAFRADVTTGK